MWSYSIQNSNEVKKNQMKLVKTHFNHWTSSQFIRVGENVQNRFVHWFYSYSAKKEAREFFFRPKLLRFILFTTDATYVTAVQTAIPATFFSHFNCRYEIGEQ